MSSSWHPVCPSGDLPADGKLAVTIAGWDLLLLREGGSVHAYIDRCPHQAARLSPGKVRRGSIMCPLHGARFKIATGECIGGAYRSLRSFAVREENGTIAVELPGETADSSGLPL
ncbi:Rieske (2Fe-2S) protein [Erythrobacter tepidarius]|uniref:Rieske (2Fe-2S) protein n=1 Tax=Erythrobacter tepidarius TaxID=60454 RepID=UPI001FED22E3|nr:Rieske (2Fe-2S) protein [Erythrobacter tepidarius]